MPAQKVNLAITYGIQNTVHTKPYYEPSGNAIPASADNTTPAVVYTSDKPLSDEFMASEGSTIDGYLYKFSDGNDYGTVDFSGTHLVYTPNAAAANKTVLIHVKAFSGGGISGDAGNTAYVEHKVTVGAIPIPNYSKDASLASLTYQIVDGANGTVLLESDKYEYSITLPFGTVIGKEITLQHTLTDSTANVSATTSGTTSYAGNNATVTVTAQDPSVMKEYKVHFHVAPMNVSYSVANKDTGAKYEDGDTILINTESAVGLRINHGSGIGGAGSVHASVEDSSVIPNVGAAHSGIYPNTILLVELKAAKEGDTKLFVKFYAESETIFEGKTPIATITLNLVQSLHKPVTNITDVPTVATVGTDLALTGMVAPADATNKVIAWSVTDAGTTNATIVEGKLKTTATGTVKVTATITNGLTDSSNYTKGFDITVTDSAPDKTALTAEISKANNAKSGISINDNAASSVASGTRFVTTAEMNALTDAIVAAQAVANNSASTATQVNDAITTLTNAVTAFNIAIKTGTYSGGSSGGGGVGGGGSSSPSTPPTKPTEPVSGESNTNANVDNKGNSTVNVTDKNISDAVKVAQEVATKKGVNAGEVTAVINVTSPANSNPNTVSVNLPKTVQEQVISSKIGNLVIAMDKPDISIGMNLATITEMNKQAKADIQISAIRTDATKLSTEAKNAIGTRPAYDLRATYASGSKSITSFGTGLVSVAIPYTLQKGEIAGGLYAVYVDSNGKVSYITNSSYDAENKVLRFSTNHFSVYGISYKAPIAFTDIATHWAKTDIEFAVNRGLMLGTSNTTFAPNSAMTYGMFVTALGRLSGVNGKSITDTTFAPEQAITRQEMATMMSSYASALGYQVPKPRVAVTFADNSAIASWAAPAVKQMQMAGILNGKDGNRFDPTGIATRGEISAMLRRYVELFIDRTTTEGFTTNDSGSSLYYESGKAVTGTQTIRGVAYTFNGYGETTRETAAVAAITPDAALPDDGKKYITYKLVKGDTLWDLARKYGTTVKAIVALNRIQNSNIVPVGLEIKIPQKD